MLGLFSSTLVILQEKNAEMEGFLDAMNELKEQLLVGSRQLDVISIIRMRGLVLRGSSIFMEKVIANYFE
ncbi:hypothetical protein K7X08_006508 [Anisodus acutangulus]|uniref:Uncharacterized protein n=1 Tax=Anisodus acutangulus TaxID=402998 RepID=A0A9Q1MVL6_9SOLA|nr:hypothetical protein K7X08_006508 [Anisodus acutangulus]